MNVIDRLLKRPLKITKRLENIFNILQYIYKVNLLKRNNNYIFCLQSELGPRLVKINYCNDVYTLYYYKTLEGFNLSNFYNLENKNTVSWIFTVKAGKQVDITSEPYNITGKAIDLAILEIENNLNIEYEETKQKDKFLQDRNKYFTEV